MFKTVVLVVQHVLLSLENALTDGAFGVCAGGRAKVVLLGSLNSRRFKIGGN